MCDKINVLLFISMININKIICITNIMYWIFRLYGGKTNAYTIPLVYCNFQFVINYTPGKFWGKWRTCQIKKPNKCNWLPERNASRYNFSTPVTQKKNSKYECNIIHSFQTNILFTSFRI